MAGEDGSTRLDISVAITPMMRRLGITFCLVAVAIWYQQFMNNVLLRLYLKHTVDSPTLHDVFDDLWSSQNRHLLILTWYSPFLFVGLVLADRLHLCKTGIPRTMLADTSPLAWTGRKFWGFVTDPVIHVTLRRVAVMNMLKSTCGVITIMPDRAHPTREFCSNPEARKSFPFASCGDMIFSGHAAHIYIMLAALVHDDRIGPHVAIAIGVISSVLLVVTRMHYSVDVVISAFAVYFVERCFPYDIKTPPSRARQMSFSGDDLDDVDEDSTAFREKRMILDATERGDRGDCKLIIQTDSLAPFYKELPSR